VREYFQTGVLFTWPGVSLAVLCLALLPVSTAVGLPFACALSIWFVYLGVRQSRFADAPEKRKGFVLLAGSFLSLLLVVFYFHGFVRPGYIPLA
jgi:hypothetical protein